MNPFVYQIGQAKNTLYLFDDQAIWWLTCLYSKLNSLLVSLSICSTTMQNIRTELIKEEALTQEQREWGWER